MTLERLQVALGIVRAALRRAADAFWQWRHALRVRGVLAPIWNSVTSLMEGKRMHLTMILAVWALAGPLLAAGGTYVWQRLELTQAVEDERAAGVIVCNARVVTIEKAHNDAVAARAAEAKAAADAITPTPEGKAELAELCKKSASCRSQRKAGK